MVSIPASKPRIVEFDVLIEKDETGAFIVTVPALPGCHTFGKTKKQALERIREAISLYIDENGPPVSRVIGLEKVRVEA